MFQKARFTFIYIFVFTILVQLGSKAQTWPTDTIHVQINTNDPQFPFPQFLEYDAGKSLAANNAVGVTHADMEKAMREAYQIMMHRALKVPGKVLNGVQYMQFNNNTVPQNYGTFVSEGDGYALLAAAYFADKPTFDGLWAWVHDNRLSKVNKYWDGTPLRAAYTYGAGFAGWECTDADGVGSTNINSAGDGDVDIAMALLIASKQWPTGGITTYNGTLVTYKTEALKMITALVDTLYYTTSPFGAQAGVKGYLSGIVGIDGYIKSGNTWGEVTNWRYTAANTAYPWATNKPDPIQVNSKYVDYNAPAYFDEFAKFLAANGGTAWQISQCNRCAASGDWTIKQMYDQGFIASAGNYTVSDNGAATTFGSFAAGEDFRMAWRTILNYVWHGNPTTKWDPATHQIIPGANTYEYDMALRHKEFLKFPNSLPSSSANAFCSKLGASPDPGQPNWKGVAQIKQQYAPNGSVLANYGVNWMAGTGMSAAVASNDLDLTAELYRQCELSWDDQSGSAVVTPPLARYINSTPKYFHGWFRTLGMLTASGNLHAPENMVAAANVKVYMSVDKTFAYEGDIVNYQVSYRNYGAAAAAGVTVTTTVDPGYTIVSASGGVISGNTITWSIGTLPGFKTNALAATMGVKTFVVKVKPVVTATVACLTSTITATNAPSWTSNEYPNNASYTMERNCVDLLKDRVLAIQKTTDRSVMNPGDIVNFTLDFENKTGSNLWLNGGRDRVILSYANYDGGTGFYQFYRIWHTAQEAYINLGNYRVSYFMNDAAAIGKYNAATNPTGWDTYVDNQNDLDKYGYNPLTLPVNQQLNFTYQKIPWGSDANGAWNQRVITQFANVLSAPSTHIFDKLDSEYLIHKGVKGPGFTRTRFESKPSSTLAPRLADDWSFDPTANSGSLDGQGKYFFPVTPSYTDATTAPRFSPVLVNNYSKDACGGPVQNFSKVLFEEFDGYTWRRIAGNGPLPGRETYNVVVTDSIPIELAWSAFTDDNAVGITATYTALTGNPKFSGYVKWSIPVMLTGETGNLSYKTIAKSPCAEKTFINAGWIWSDVDSPDSSAVNLKLTCNPVPPTPPIETSLVKTANTASAVVGDVINYTLTFTNKDGSTASWAGASTVAADWQTLGTGVTIPKLNGAVISLDQNGGNNAPGANGYSFGPKKAHGVNGWMEATIAATNSSNLSFLYRYQSPTQNIRLEVSPNIGGNNNIAFYLYQNGSATPFVSLTGLAFPGSSSAIKIRTQLLNDKLYIWVNDFTGAPLKVISGITQLGAGFAGIYGNGSQQALSAYTAHFDSAFDLVISDPVPSQLNNITNISNTGVLTGSTITWPTVAGPILANAVIVRTFDATVNTCTDFITNIGNASVYGVTNIQSQYVITCGAVIPPCTKPTITSAATGTVCSGVAQNYAITSSVPSSYAWSRAAVVGITNAANTTGTGTPITETLTNSTNAAVVVRYVITPTSTTGSCVGTAFNYDVTVNPKPTISSSATGTICSGVAQAYTITSVVPSSYSWSRAAVVGITNAAATAQTANPIAEVLTNSTTAAVNVVYTITPTSTTGSCAGTPFTYTVTVNPAPVISSAATGTICSGVAQAYTITSVVPSTYSWSRAAVVGITNAAVTAQTANPITETLTNSTTAAVSVVYTITPTSTTGTCAGPASTYTVTVNPKPAISSAATGTVCSDVAQNYAITSVVPSSYSWSRAAVVGITNAANTTGTGTPITETLTNSTAAGIVVRYVITPTSTTGTCVGTAFNYDVTVNPKPVITSVATGTVCSGVAQNYAITSNVTATYAWSRAAVVGITNAANTAGTGTPITETLTNSTTAAVVVRYVITPTAGCAGTPFNYDVTVNPAPAITSVSTGSVCSGVAQSYTITSNIPSSDAWTRAAVTNITPATGSGTTSPITETLTNSTAAAIVVRYVITPTATTGTCAGTPFNYDVTVNPKPTITSAATGSVCSGVAQNYAITSNVASSYSWTRASVANITPATGAGTTTPITETLTNATTSAIVVRYVITPTSTAGTCAGTPFNYDVTVNPKPTITSVATGTTCTGVALNYLITSDVASNYSWTRASVANITPTTGAGTTNPITETLTSTATGPVVVRYVIIPTSTAGTCAGAAFNYDVTVSATAAPTVAITTTPGTTICDGTAVTFTTVVGSGGTPTYKWTSDKQAGTISTADSYSSSTLVDGEVITVEITSSLGCAVPKTATTSATMKVNPNVTPSVTAAITAPTGTICPGANVTFTATPTNPGAGPKYQWYKGTAPGSIITGETNSTYSTTGALNGDTYYVELTSNETCASPAKVNSTAVSVTVTPVPAPTVTITGDKPSICSGNPVVFTATAGGTGVTSPAPAYQWYIGTTAISGETNSTFTTSSLTDPATTPSPGNQVHVTIVSKAACTDNAAVSSNTVTTTVNPGVLPGSISTGSSFCSGTTPGAITELTPATGITGAATYTWEQNTSTPVNWITAVGTPTNGGKGFTPSGTVTTDISYRRTVTDNTLPSACQTATTNSITYTVIALPTISSAATGTICSKVAQNYTITSAIPSNYVWSRGSVTGITNPGITNQISNPIVESLENTTSSAINVTYSIVPTSTTGSCVGATFTYTVTVNPLPVVTALSPADIVCSGVSHTYTITSNIGATYSWARAAVSNISVVTGSGTGSSITETLTNQTIGTASAADITVNYVIVPTSTTGSCVGPAVTYPLTVAVAAVPTVSVTANKTGICAGVPVKFTATGTATGTHPTYQWYQSSAANPGGVAVGTNSATYTTTSLALSTDKVWVEMTSNFPCIAVGSANPATSVPVSIDVKQPPKPQIETDQVICSADGGFMYTATNLQTGSTLQWQLNAQNIAKATDITYKATESGLYTVVEDNGYCTGGSSASKLTIVPTPDPYAGSDMYVTEGTFVQLQAGGGITGTTYSWTPATGLNSTTISNPSFKADNTITYTVTLTNTDAATGHTCSGESSVTITVIKPIVVPNVITINGDGSNDTWHIQHIEGYPNATFEIYNRWGNLVWKSTGYPKEWDGTNFRNGEVLPDGTYFYIINLHSQIFTEPYTGWIQIVK